MSDPVVKVVLDGLTELIMKAACSQASEEGGPSRNPDDSDDHIKRQRELVEELRDIRARFEDVVSGRIVPKPKRSNLEPAGPTGLMNTHGGVGSVP